MTAPRLFQMLVSPHVGGGAKLAMQLHAHAVQALGPVSQLLLPGGGEAERSAQSAGFPYARYRVDRLTGTSRLRSLLENVALYRPVMRQKGAIVHVHAPFVYGAARPFFAAAKLKTVLHVHLDFTADQLAWALSSPPDTVIICAEFMRAAVTAALSPIAGTRIEVMRNAIDVRRFAGHDRGEAKRRLGVAPDVCLMMVIANLAPHKGQETAIRAVAGLRELGHEALLWVVGGERTEGQGYLEYLKRLSRELRTDDRVTFTGFRNDVPELLQAADMLLLPSTSEGLPLTILEAQASGTTVLAAPTAGIPEVIDHGRTGFLIAAHDVGGYVAQVSELLRNRELQRSVMAAAYRHVCEHHDLTSYGDRMLAEYARLVPFD